MTKILGKSVATAAQMAEYLLSVNKSPKFSRNISALEFCQLFLDACAKEGVRGDVAFCQSLKETGNFNFRGDVKYTQNNFAGIGATGGVPGCTFKDIETGILAQAQHLKTYATKAALNEVCVDPRRTTWFVNAKGGTSPDVETLGGSWAVPGYDTKKYSSLAAANAAKDSYGYQIMNILNKILKIDVKEESTVTNVNANLEIRQCFLTNNNCYKQGRTIVPKGIVVHSTGANNPSLKRYVQPDDGVLGTNPYDNHWNRSGISKCVHAFIGKDKDGVVRVYQTLPWNFRCWGCGSGSKGSYNNNFIQFEICEDGLNDVNYFNTAFKLALELCAYLAKQYKLPVENIVSHNEANKLGYASGHIDCDHWLKKFGKDMNWFRDEVGKRNGTVVAPQSSTRSYIMKGDKGEDVKVLQENLNYLGYSCGSADGDFGAKTDTALRKFQKAYKLTVDGKYGALSKQKLEDAVAKKKKAESTPAATTKISVSGGKYIYNGIDYSIVFNPTYYTNKYGDLKNAFGTNATKLFEHFIQHGMSEQRRGSDNFDVIAYKNRYVDLQKAFGNDYPSYYKHYIQYGKNENRKTI